MAHILRICKHLEELSELQVHRIEFVMSAEDLLETIKCAPKLQSLHYFVSVSVWNDFKTTRRRMRKSNSNEPLPVEVLPGQIDLDAFMKMMQIVRQRK